MININPTKLKGPWKDGFALDQHTVSSIFLGYNEFGHEVFDTKRSEIGQLLYNLKYRGDRSSTDLIAKIVSKFIKEDWGIANVIDAIVPVPPLKC